MPRLSVNRSLSSPTVWRSRTVMCCLSLCLPLFLSYYTQCCVRWEPPPFSTRCLASGERDKGKQLLDLQSLSVSIVIFFRLTGHVNTRRSEHLRESVYPLRRFRSVRYGYCVIDFRWVLPVQVENCMSYKIFYLPGNTWRIKFFIFSISCAHGTVALVAECVECS